MLCERYRACGALFREVVMARRVWWWAWRGPLSLAAVGARWLVLLGLFLAAMVAVGVGTLIWEVLGSWQR